MSGILTEILHQPDARDIDTERDLNLDLIENAHDAIYVHDREGVFVYLNRKAEELSGYARAELLNQHFSLILNSDDERVVRTKLRKHRRLRWDQKFEVKIKAKTGETIPVELSISPIMEDKRLIGFEGVARDIRERKQSQKLLEQRDARIQRLSARIQTKNRKIAEGERVQSEFVSNITHEFRTPINTILGYTELLREELKSTLTSGQLIALDNIRNSSMDLLNMVQDVINLSKLSSEHIELEVGPCSVNDLIEITVDTVAPIASGKGLDLRSSIEPGLPAVMVDFRRIYEVLVHLAANAIKFSKEGWIEIGARLDMDDIRFYVSDSGIGIPKEKGELIFREFRQVDNSNRRSYGGLGLGLTLSQRFVELHGGEIGFSSKPGDGSTFFFTIPMEAIQSKDGHES